MRILICDELHPTALDVFEAHGFTPTVRTGMSEDELIAAVPGVHALVVRSATTITRRVIEAADALRVVGRAGVGVDNVDTDAASERGVVVMNTPTGNTTTTAELAIALMAALARHLPLADRRTRSGSWGKKGLTGIELTGKVLGIVGLGRIGRVVAERGLGLSMQVIAADPYLSKTGAGSPIPGVELMELDELLPRADFVSLHMPLMDSTRGILGAERLAKMKLGARLINAARGGLVDEAALAVALDEGRLAGAALDVLSQEPPPAGHPLLGRDDVILTPHLGASSHEAQLNVATQVAEQISLFLRDGVAHNAVNAPALPAKALRELAPYIRLAEKMGSFLAQRCEDPVRKIELTFSGEIVSREAHYLELAFTAAVLRQGLGRTVNFVNAPLLAKERGLRILRSEDGEASGFTNRLKARVSGRGGAHSHLVAGTIHGDKPRFTRIDEVHVDLDPSGHLLVTRHHDSPGVLGRLGTLLGEADVNIRRVELGPPSEASGGLAAAFLTLYSVPDEAVLERLRGIEAVEQVQLIEL